MSKGAARILTRALVADLADRFPDIVISDWMPGMLATRMGIPDGIAPEQSATWGAELALWHDPALTGTTFEQAVEIPPPRGLKARIKDRLLGGAAPCGASTDRDGRPYRSCQRIRKARHICPGRIAKQRA